MTFAFFIPGYSPPIAMIFTVKLGTNVTVLGLLTNSVAPVVVTLAIDIINSAKPPGPPVIFPTNTTGTVLKDSLKLIGICTVDNALMLTLTT